MANIKLLILAASAAFFISPAFAGYANLSPPSGFSSSGGINFYKPINASQFITNTVRTNAALNVAGKSVVIPVAMRFAANSGRYLATAAYGHPLLFAAAAAAGAYAYFNSQDLVVNEGVWSIADTSKSCFSNCFEYKADDWRGGTMWLGSPDSAAAVYWSWQNSNNTNYTFSQKSCVDNGDNSYSCQATAFFRDGGAEYGPFAVKVLKRSVDPFDKTEYRPVSSSEFQDLMENVPVPQSLPSSWPIDFPNLPIQIPLINPSTDPVPVSEPLLIPVGDPVPIPNSDPATNPQQYAQPMVRVVPSPTLLEPWRVDLQPVDRITTSPTPITEPITENLSDPNSQTQKPENISLCDQYPDILACQKPNFDTPSTDQIQTRDLAISITPDSGWGADNAACPPARHLPGANVDFEFTTICNFMLGIRPVMISVAWLMAAMILIGFKRGE